MTNVIPPSDSTRSRRLPTGVCDSVSSKEKRFHQFVTGIFPHRYLQNSDLNDKMLTACQALSFAAHVGDEKLAAAAAEDLSLPALLAVSDQGNRPEFPCPIPNP